MLQRLQMAGILVKPAMTCFMDLVYLYMKKYKVQMLKFIQKESMHVTTNTVDFMKENFKIIASMVMAFNTLLEIFMLANL